MNANQAKEWLPFIQAVADGKTIQISMSGGWVDISDVLGYLDCGVEHLRIKPREFKNFSLPWEYIDKTLNFATYRDGDNGTVFYRDKPVFKEHNTSIGSILSWHSDYATCLAIRPIDEGVNESEYLACRNPDDQP
jgi:hypothetical protein